MINNREFLEGYQNSSQFEFLEKTLKKSSGWFLINGIYFPKKIIHNSKFFEQIENEIHLVILRPVLFRVL